MVYLGEQFVNNPTLSDVTFLIEGKRLYAHKICLLPSSDAFRAMFDGGYRVFNEFNARKLDKKNIFEEQVVSGITIMIMEFLKKFADTERFNWGQCGACIGIACAYWFSGEVHTYFRETIFQLSQVVELEEQEKALEHAQAVDKVLLVSVEVVATRKEERHVKRRSAQT